MSPRELLADSAAVETDDERLDAFDYPDAWAIIADRPAPVRDASRLLVYDRRTGRVDHRRFLDLPEYVLSGDIVVVNDSRVIPARLAGVKVPSGGHIELLLTRREEPGVWRVLVKGKVRPGQRIAFDAGGEGEFLDPDDGRARLRLTPDDPAWLERVGEVPLPPYIAKVRGADAAWAEDRSRYQTVYARADGSVAAPTAGLHFTGAVFDGLARRGASVAAVTLHVGPGTFEPVRAERIADHRMAAEWGEVSPDAARVITRAREAGGRVIAVGTTATRLLETAGAGGALRPYNGETDVFIRPGHRWRVVDALLTNFHLPRSTPLLLAAALCGRAALLELYREAAAEGYRFYSYGDAMLIL
ncbi:MAG TPA: tRNA preQ1(34) S-adenosylmethionine ribosyltransferase-isomerase QueA [Nitrospiria bacterium]|nr:tRNA preQ1(34) S-adenosylmethionine ribosyltransferase-isomerase QueA [Nitrospiria bacterium]